jgi:peptide/nickel transport system permease protein
VAASFIGTTIYAIGAQVGLEFLGLGDLGAVTWGTNLYWASNDAALLTGAWWTFVPTGLCVALVGFALTLLSFALDEVTNPRLRRRARRPRASANANANASANASARANASAATRPSPNATEGALLSVRDLRIRYAGAPAAVVDGVSFDLMPGEIFGLAGESGSGKSTIGQALLRLLPDDAEVTGQTCFGDLDVSALHGEALRRWRWRDAAIVFQSAMSALNPDHTVGDQFADTLAAHGIDHRSDARARAAELLAMVGLPPHVIDAWPHQLSGGMRQRVGLALALALDPRLVILDEPTTALDVVVQRQILERLVGLQRRRGFAILFITHDLPLLMSVATRIGILRDGKLVEIAATEQLRAAPRHPYTRELLSSFPPLPPVGEDAREVAR